MMTRLTGQDLNQGSTEYETKVKHSAFGYSFQVYNIVRFSNFDYNLYVDSKFNDLKIVVFETEHC